MHMHNFGTVYGAPLLTGTIGEAPEGAYVFLMIDIGNDHTPYTLAIDIANAEYLYGLLGEALREYHDQED